MGVGVFFYFYNAYRVDVVDPEVKNAVSGVDTVDFDAESSDEIVETETEVETKVEQGSVEVSKEVVLLDEFYEKYGPESKVSLDGVIRAYEKSLPVFSAETIEGIRKYIEKASGGTTADMITAGHTSSCLAFYLTASEYAGIMKSAKGQHLKGLIADEYAKWNRMAVTIYDIGTDIACMEYFGGSIIGPVCGSIVSRVNEIGNENVLILKRCLVGSYRSKGATSAEMACRNLMKTIDEEIEEHHRTEFSEYEDEESYKKLYRNAKTKRGALEPLIRDWIKARTALGRAVNREYAGTAGELLRKLEEVIEC